MKDPALRDRLAAQTTGAFDPMAERARAQGDPQKQDDNRARRIIESAMYSAYGSTQARTDGSEPLILDSNSMLAWPDRRPPK